MRKDVSIHAPTITITNILLIIIIIGIKTNTYLWIRSQRRIYSPPAPAESWGQSGICQRLSQIFPSSSHRSSSSTAPVRSVPAVVCSPLIPPNWSSVCESVWQCVCVCSGPSSSSFSSMLKQQNEFFFCFTTMGWLSLSQPAARGLCSRWRGAPCDRCDFKNVMWWRL